MQPLINAAAFFPLAAYHPAAAAMAAFSSQFINNTQTPVCLLLSPHSLLLRIRFHEKHQIMKMPKPVFHPRMHQIPPMRLKKMKVLIQMMKQRNIPSNQIHHEKC